jgi:hypothetical protein
LYLTTAAILIRLFGSRYWLETPAVTLLCIPSLRIVTPDAPVAGLLETPPPSPLLVSASHLATSPALVEIVPGIEKTRFLVPEKDQERNQQSCKTSIKLDSRTGDKTNVDMNTILPLHSLVVFLEENFRCGQEWAKAIVSTVDKYFV